MADRAERLLAIAMDEHKTWAILDEAFQKENPAQFPGELRQDALWVEHVSRGDCLICNELNVIEAELAAESFNPKARVIEVLASEAVVPSIEELAEVIWKRQSELATSSVPVEISLASAVRQYLLAKGFREHRTTTPAPPYDGEGEWT